MDMNDLEKDLSGIQLGRTRPGKRVDYDVTHSRLKVLASKLLAVLFFIAILLFGMYTIMNAGSASIDIKVAAAIAIIYIVLGAYVSLKLWNLELMGWVAVFFVALAGVGLSAFSAVNHGIMVGTIPIIAVSIVALAVLYWIRDLYRIKKFGDIFRAPQ
jgi:hypothetical protein